MAAFAKRLIALVAAYGLVAALFLGAIAVGQSAAAAPICHAGSSSGGLDQAPAAPNHDLACVVAGCCGLRADGPLPASVAPAASLAYSRVVWAGRIAGHFAPDVAGGFSARGPPALG